MTVQSGRRLMGRWQKLPEKKNWWLSTGLTLTSSNRKRKNKAIGVAVRTTGVVGGLTLTLIESNFKLKCRRQQKNKCAVSPSITVGERQLGSSSFDTADGAKDYGVLYCWRRWAAAAAIFSCNSATSGMIGHWRLSINWRKEGTELKPSRRLLDIWLTLVLLL